MAAGCHNTCALQAFMSQLGFAVPLYVTSIAFYLSTAIMNDFKISKTRWVEKWCHILPNSIPIILAILLLAFNKYGVDGEYGTGIDCDFNYSFVGMGWGSPEKTDEFLFDF